MTKEIILDTFKDINHAYNNCSMHDSLCRMLDELIEEVYEKGYAEGYIKGVNEERGVFE